MMFKRFKKDLNVRSIENFNDLKVGDVIEGYELVETQRVLD